MVAVAIVRTKYYHIDQAPPPRHWIQRQVGWFGRLALFIVVFGFVGTAGAAYTIRQNDSKSLAARASEPEHLQKVTQTLPQTKAENIIDIQSIFDQWAKDHPGQKWGMVAKSLDGPMFEASHEADKKFKSASIYKLLLTLPLFQRVPVEQQKYVTLKVDGQSKSLATCVDLMLRLSDNPCGEAVGAYLGWSRAQKVLNQAGYTHTDFKNDNLQTSPSDTAAFLQQLQGDMYGNRLAKDTVMGSLLKQRWRSGIPTGCPGCTTANKTGQIGNVTHDAAVVDYTGGKYVLVIFSEGGNFRQIAELSGLVRQKIIDTANVR